MHLPLKCAPAFALVVLLPCAAFAQASITGVVRDGSGGVLPGVTVEAASPALIEKVRTSVTDGGGGYQIVDLRPGTYTVTFTLPGFNTLKRDGVELTGSSTVGVDAELRVGAVEETITVTGAAPIVDVQNTTKQTVLNKEVVDAIPTARNYYTLAVLIPGVNSNATDIGGNIGDVMASLAAHGGKTGDQRITQNGVTLMTLQVTGGAGGSVPNVGAASEVVIDSGSTAADLPTGGVRVNFIPRDGGNTLRGSMFATYANEHMANDNLTQRLKDRGLASVSRIKKNWDLNPGFGGPIARDRLWYYFTGRYQGAQAFAAGMFHNRNAFRPNVWTYEADAARPALSSDGDWEDAQLRITWQANQKNKFAATWDQNWWCRCPNTISPTVAPEAANDRRFPVQRLLHGEWWSPLTNRVLAEVVALHRVERWGANHLQNSLADARGGFPQLGLDELTAYRSLIGVTEQSSGLQYHGPAQMTVPGVNIVGGAGAFNNTWVENYFVRGALSYVTGSHNLKVGWNDVWGFRVNRVYDLDNPLWYRFNNGIPNQITIRGTPYTIRDEQDYDMGVYAQDKWTVRRLTLTGAVRLDVYKNHYPEQTLGPGPFVPDRNWTLPAEPNLNWKDLSWRSGATYDVAGDGKTAVKFSLNRYLAAQALGGLGSNTNPIVRLVQGTPRAWTDTNRDFVPQCDLLNLDANGECGPVANRAFGTQAVSEVTDQALREGWGKRGFNWELTAGAQREIFPRVSVDVTYFRRWYGNFAVTDDLNLSPADLDAFDITAPTNSQMPGGGGYTIAGFYDRKESAFGRPTRNTTVLSDTYGRQIEHWNGFDATVQARLQAGVLVQGGISSGKTTTDNCEIVAKLPEMLLSGTVLTVANAGVWLPQEYCHQESPFITQVKTLAVYTIPRLDVQIAGTVQSIPGAPLAANFVLPTEVAARTLGRPLAGRVANVGVNVVAPGAVFGERLNQLDLRIGRIVRLGQRRATLSLDIYNATNSDTILTFNNNYAALWRPTSILQARFFKGSIQVDF
jgi:hypothetical protein